MVKIAADRDLLLGLLGLQTNLIDQADLVAAFHTWSRDRSRPMGQVLVDSGALDPGRRALLDSLVEEHLRRHGGDPEKSLAAVGAGLRERPAGPGGDPGDRDPLARILEELST